MAGARGGVRRPGDCEQDRYRRDPCPAYHAIHPKRSTIMARASCKDLSASTCRRAAARC